MRNSRPRRRGFTLIELLIGMVLAVMLLVVTARVFSTALNARGRLRESVAQTEALRRAYEMVSRDIHSAVVPPDDSGMQFGLGDTGGVIGANALQFASVTGEPLLAGRPASETVLIQYSIAEDPRTGKPTFWRYATPYPVPAGTTPGAGQNTQAIPLIPGVAGASYLFYSRDQQNWIESWDGQAGLPTAIRIDLVLGESSRTTTDGTEPRTESWIFHLPAAPFANDRAAEAAEAAAATGGTP